MLTEKHWSIDKFFPLAFALIVTVVMSSEPAKSASLNDGLIGHWKFDSSTLDSSGNGLHGAAINNPTFEEGIIGSAVKLNGVDQFVSFDSVPQSNFEVNDFTFSTWIKTTASPFRNPILEFNPLDKTGEATYRAVIKNGNDLEALFRPIETSSQEKTEMHASGTFNDGEWHHVVMTRDTASQLGQLYVDGVLREERADNLASHTLVPDGTMDIGRQLNNEKNFDVYFNGSIDDVRIYDRSISTEEVEQLATQIRRDITQEELEDRDRVIEKIVNADKIISNVSFEAENQSIWGAGDELGFEFKKQIGLTEEAFDPLSFGQTFSAGGHSVDASVEADPYAYLDIDIDFGAGAVDASYSAEVLNSFSLDEAGGLQLSRQLQSELGTFQTSAPTASAYVAFEYGVDGSVQLLYTNSDGERFQLLDPQVSEDGTLSFSDAERLNFDDVFQRADGSPALKGTKILIDDNGLGSLVSDDPQTFDLIEALLGEGVAQAVSEVGSISITQIDRATLEYNGELENGVISGGTTTNDVANLTLDIDKVARLIATAAGVPIRDEFFEGSLTIDGGFLASIDVEYETLDIDLNTALAIYQELDIDPTLMVMYSTNTGQIWEGSINEMPDVFELPESGNLIIDTTYYLDATLTNEAGITGDVDLDYFLGQVNGFVDVLGPFNIDIPETTLFGPESLDLVEGSIKVFGQDNIEFTGFDTTVSEQWEIDLFDSAPVETFHQDAAIATVQTNGLGDRSGFKVDGTAFFENGDLVGVTNSPTLIYFDISVPLDAVAFALDFFAETFVADDVFTVLFDDDLLFRVTGADIVSDWISTGLLDIARFAGQDILLTLAMLSPEGVSSTFRFDNLAFFDSFDAVETTPIRAVPLPGSILFLLSGVGVLIVMRSMKTPYDTAV